MSNNAQSNLELFTRRKGIQVGVQRNTEVLELNWLGTFLCGPARTKCGLCPRGPFAVICAEAARSLTMIATPAIHMPAHRS